MKTIHTLITDIQYLLDKRDGWFTDELSHQFSDAISTRLKGHFGAPERTPTLRLSKMGPTCPRALWYSIHHPELATPLPSWAMFKYAYGHIIEGLAIPLAKAAGHAVTGEQDELIVDGISGHRDCVIDGCIVDIKSTSSFSFKKFKDGSIEQDDSFGYLDQLDGYMVGSLEDPLVTVKDRACLLAIDKQLGHMCLHEHGLREQSIRDRIKSHKEIVRLPVPPGCECGTISDGKSGNIKLDTKASYSSYKFCCFPGLRTFLYANGPVYLTTVVRKPDVQEIDQHGKAVYR
ncbi:MAG: hypothetical protein ACREHG_00050 [Candidatus Saccharimonadales bacterium]